MGALANLYDAYERALAGDSIAHRAMMRFFDDHPGQSIAFEVSRRLLDKAVRNVLGRYPPNTRAMVARQAARGLMDGWTVARIGAEFRQLAG